MSSLRSLRMLLGAGALALACTSCAPTEWVPVRYSAALGGDHDSELETNRCAHACYDQAHGDESRFYQCLTLCPGVAVDGATTCEEPTETPEAFCYTHWVEREVEDGDSVAVNFLGELFGAVLNGLVEAATTPSDHDHDHDHDREREHEARRENHERHDFALRRNDDDRERPAPRTRDYRPARPRKGH